MLKFILIVKLLKDQLELLNAYFLNFLRIGLE